MNYAIESTGKEIVIIKDNKIIAKGRSIAMHSNDFVTIKLYDDYIGKYFNKFSERTIEILSTIGHLHYFPTSGLFKELSLDFEEDEEETAAELIENIFSDTTAVDYFNLTYGMVPEHFKEAEGYKSAIHI